MDQLGTSHMASIDQTGVSNDAYAEQASEGNSITQVQDGNSNYARAHQNVYLADLYGAGGDNVATQTQIGDRNNAGSLQGYSNGASNSRARKNYFVTRFRLCKKR